MLIQSYSFGSIIIDGENYEDVKLYKNKVTPWKYIKHHRFTIEDIRDILKDIDFLVMGIGYSGMLSLEPDVLPFLKEKKITVIVEQTTQAVEKYNKLTTENKKVAAILHSTC